MERSASPHSTSHPSAAPNGRQPSMLTAALHTVARLSGAEATALAQVGGKALRHYGAGLRQYLVIRAGSTQLGAEAWEKLGAVVRALPEGQLLKAPGERAQLYHQAREIALSLRGGRAGPSPDALAALPWLPSENVPKAVLHEVRACLDPFEAELLELRHARELSPEEIAHVVGRAVVEVLEQLELAVGKVQLRLARMRTDRTVNLRRLLLEAFALDDQPAPTGDSREPLAAGTIVGGRFELKSRLGDGAFGDVYLAHDTEVPGHQVALKLLHQPAFSDEARQSALRELHLIASVFHPSVVQFKDHGWFDGRLWFVMPLYRGETLDQRISRGALSRREAHAIFVPLARALAAIHAAGIRHQDIKPENVLLAELASDEGEELLPVLLDMGVAAKEAEMVIAGTPTYFAPEVAAQFARKVEQKPRVTNSADVFSLALTLRNALEPGTRRGVPAGAVEAFIESRATQDVNLPEARDLRYLAPTLGRWLSRDASERPTASELARELDELIRPERDRARRRKLMRWLVPAAATLMLTFGSAVSWLHHRSETRRLEAERAQLAATALRASLRDSQRREEALVDETGRLRESFAQSRRDGESLSEQLARLQTEIADRRGDIERLRRAVEDAQETQAHTAENLAQSEARVSALGRAKEEAERSLAETEQQRQALTSQLELSARRNDQLDADLTALRDQATQREARLAAVTAELAAETAKGTRLAQEVESATAARLRMEASLAEARRQLAERTEQSAVEATPPREPAAPTESPDVPSA